MLIVLIFNRKLHRYLLLRHHTRTARSKATAVPKPSYLHVSKLKKRNRNREKLFNFWNLVLLTDSTFHLNDKKNKRYRDFKTREKKKRLTINRLVGWCENGLTENYWYEVVDKKDLYINMSINYYIKDYYMTLRK